MSDSPTLYELIEQLTHQHATPVTRHGEFLRTRIDPPLLTVLENARTSSLGRGNQTKSRSERLQLNIAASELHTTITRRIRTWARTAGYRPPRTGWPTTRLVLRRWYAITKHSPDTTAHQATLRGWINQITELTLDPPRRWTLNAACPTCNQRWAVDTDGHRIDALQVTDRDPITTSETLCRNCQAVWHGIDGARQLALDIDRQKTA